MCVGGGVVHQNTFWGSIIAKHQVPILFHNEYVISYAVELRTWNRIYLHWQQESAQAHTVSVHARKSVRIIIIIISSRSNLRSSTTYSQRLTARLVHTPSRRPLAPHAPQAASPASKRQRLFRGSNGSGIGDGDGCSHTSYGRPHEDGGGSTFAINNYEDSDFDDDDDDDPAGDATASPAGVAGGGGGGGGGLARKNKKKPWKLHGRSGGGRGRGRSMHDANLYRHYRPDFRELAREYPGEREVHVT